MTPDEFRTALEDALRNLKYGSSDALDMAEEILQEALDSGWIEALCRERDAAREELLNRDMLLGNSQERERKLVEATAELRADLAVRTTQRADWKKLAEELEERVEGAEARLKVAEELARALREDGAGRTIPALMRVAARVVSANGDGPVRLCLEEAANEIEAHISAWDSGKVEEPR